MFWRILSIVLGILILAVVVGFVATVCLGSTSTEGAEPPCELGGTIVIPIEEEPATYELGGCGEVVVSAEYAEPMTLSCCTPGLNSCTWTAQWNVAGAEMSRFTMTAYFYIAPFSNLENWSVFDQINMTPAGATLYSADWSNSTLMASAWYTYPSLVKQLWASGQAQISYPVQGPNLWELEMTISAFVNSPGYQSPACPATVTFQEQTIGDPLGHALHYLVEWCQDHWWICLPPITCFIWCL